LEVKLADKNESVESRVSFFNCIKSHRQLELLNVTEKNYKEINTRVKAFVEESLQ